MKQLLYILSCGFILSSAFGMKYPPAPKYIKPAPRPAPVRKPRPELPHYNYIDLFVLFERGGTKSGLENFMKKGFDCANSTLWDFFVAVRLRETPMIASASLLHAIINGKQDGKTLYVRKNLDAYWNLWVNKTKDFIVLIPKTLLKNESLASLGFNSARLIPVSAHGTLSSILPAQTPINIAHFQSLFDLKNPIRKNIFVSGDGQSCVAGHPESLIAGMDQRQYTAFLIAINPFTDFAFFLSCYAGGSNLEKMNQQQEDITQNVFSLSQLRFPLAVGATTDQMVQGFLPNLDTFFTNINAYQETKNLSFLRKALLEVHQSATQPIWAIPSVRFPGINSFFRAIALNKDIKALTVTDNNAYKLNFIRIKKLVRPLEINAQTILVYPALLDLPLRLHPKSKIISMINGNALHIFDEVITNFDKHSLFDLFQQPVTSLNKVFFIKKLKDQGAIYENVTFQASQLAKPEIIFKVAASRTHPHLIGKYAVLSETGLYEISQKEALLKIKALVTAAMPSEFSLYQATGGQQTRAMLEAAIHNALTALPRPLPPRPVKK